MEGDHETSRLIGRTWDGIDDFGWDDSKRRGGGEEGVLDFQPEDERGPSRLSLDLSLDLDRALSDGRPPARARHAMLAAHALARWAWRTWEFAGEARRRACTPGARRADS